MNHEAVKRNMSDTEVRKIVCEVKKNPKCSAVEIPENLSQERSRPASASTIRIALNVNGLHGMTPRKKPSISNINIVKRLNFEKVHLTDP